MTDPNDTQDTPWWASDDPAGHRGEGGSSHGEHTRPTWWEAYESLGDAAREAAKGFREAAEGGWSNGARQPSNGADQQKSADPEHVHFSGDAACQVCPICTGLRLLGEVRPEVIQHLTEAAKHLTLAAKAVIDAQAEHLTRDERLEHIELDDE